MNVHKKTSSDDLLLGLPSELVSKSNQFPKNMQPLENQVAGHSFNDGNFSIGMLKDEEGYVFKPVNKPEVGKREILFYETLNKSHEAIDVQLKRFVPEYFGCVSLVVNGQSCQFLKLIDATNGFKKPCVMDVKMGRQTWEPSAPPRKQQKEESSHVSLSFYINEVKEQLVLDDLQRIKVFTAHARIEFKINKAKYAACKNQCGFCIPGFQVHNILSGSLEKYGKDYGYQLVEEDIARVLRKFLNWTSGRSRAIGEEMLHQLKNILSWWHIQRLYHIYSSSVLLTYDADGIDTSGRPDCAETNASQYVKVLLIDFAHVVPANNALDSNYVNGLENFVKIFTDVINEL